MRSLVAAILVGAFVVLFAVLARFDAPARAQQQPAAATKCKLWRGSNCCDPAISAHLPREAVFAACGERVDYVALSGGAPALREAVERAEATIGAESRRLHYLSVPPAAALPVVRLLGEADLVARSRIIMEKPFGTDLESARRR